MRSSPRSSPDASARRSTPESASITSTRATTPSTSSPATTTRATTRRGPMASPYLLFDSVLYVGLTAGDYYLAVSDGWNTPSPREGVLPGSEGLFDPNRSHSGQSGFGTGSYVLNVLARLDPEPPRVVSASPARGATIDQPPTYLVVQFSEEVNVQDLASRAPENIAAAIYIEGHDGVRYFPRLVSYDHATHTATFLMLDGLANGDIRAPPLRDERPGRSRRQSPRRQRPGGRLCPSLHGPGARPRAAREPDGRVFDRRASRRRRLPGPGCPVPQRSPGGGDAEARPRLERSRSPLPRRGGLSVSGAPATRVTSSGSMARISPTGRGSS